MVNSGSMVCEALRKKNHNAILMDVYFGLEDIDIFEKSASEYDVESVKKRQNTSITPILRPNVLGIPSIELASSPKTGVPMPTVVIIAIK